MKNKKQKKRHDERNKQAEELYAYVRKFAEMRLDSENKREDSLIQQSSRMQTAFSFTTAVLFMIAPIVVEYRGNISLEFFLVAFSSTTALLLVSLVFASLVQNRRLIKTFPDVDAFKDNVEKNFQLYLTQAQRDKSLVKLLSEVQKEKSELNNKRAKYIRWSMGFFYAALVLSVIWFMNAIIIILFKWGI